MATTSRSNRVDERADPGQERRLERRRVDQHEHTPERVVRGNAVRQIQKGLQPRQLVAAIQRDVVPTFRTRDHRANGDDQDIRQPVLDLAATARIFDRTEVTRQVLDRHAPLPRHRKGTSSNVSIAQARGISCFTRRLPSGGPQRLKA